LLPETPPKVENRRTFTAPKRGDIRKK